MQDEPQAFISGRAAYYNSKMLVMQLKESKGYDELKKTVGILIADFDLLWGSEKYHDVFHLRDKDNGKLFTDLIEIHTFELKKLPSSPASGAEGKMLSWMRFLKAEKEKEFEMLAEKCPMIKKAYAKVKSMSESERNQMLYDDRIKSRRDEEARRIYAVMEGHKEGHAQGREEAKLEIAKNMLSLELPLDQIVTITGLTPEEIEKLKTDHI